jgi:hypothetical protein
MAEIRKSTSLKAAAKRSQPSHAPASKRRKRNV